MSEEYVSALVGPDSGKIRVNDVRPLYLDGDISFDEVLTVHEKWKNQTEYCILAYPVLGCREVLNERNGRFQSVNHEYWGFMVSKRGNRVYQGRVKKRMRPLVDFMNHNKDKFFFSPKGRGIKKTNVLMVTLTYGKNRCIGCNNHFSESLSRCPVCNSTLVPVSEFEAWMNQGKDFNNFISQLKQHYGKISVLRSWERYPNGYPHVHAVIVFWDHEFSVRPHISKKSGKKSWIIPDVDNKKISSFHHSFVQQSGVYSFGGIRYVSKYVTKKVFEKDKNPTLVACWLYGKQQWSISRNFIDGLASVIDGPVTIPPRLDSLMHNSIKNYLEGRICYYVGIRIIPNTHDAALIRLKPPPDTCNYAADYMDLDNKYEYEEDWISDFHVSTLRCDVCGIPLFTPEDLELYGLDADKETIRFVDDGKRVTLCRSCYDNPDLQC